MAGTKKFGAFAGVFTPSLLTILGVIMYMRMGWVVGNAGLFGTLLIILIAHVISISTGLSISSIATDKKVGAGGIYYILSRSMGIPIGGAIGLTLYIGTAFSIALYLIGFAESFNGYFGLDTGINGLRITGSIALITLTLIALISTSVAIKTQFFILAAIAISLISIFFGTPNYAPESISFFADEGAVPLEVVFAIFFPAVTGFTAGIAMSGDLKNPKKDIPAGTIAAIAVGFIVYVALAIFLINYVDAATLQSDYNILMKIALFAPAVVAGIWGATLSSALGGVLGGPRILQAMSLDRITPRLFGKGKGKNNEPVNALLLVFVIAFSGILIGELDIIARVVSMFYLVAYGVINLSFFLESWANPDFQPTFKVKRWIGLIGFLASFAVMFKLDMLAMFGSIVIIIAIYFWLQRKQIALKSGNVWQSVWENIVAQGLKKLDAKETEVTSWNPNIILFSGKSEHRSYLVELGNTLSGRTGIVTNFNLILDKDNKRPLSKANQIVKDQDFEKLGVFARQVRVDNIFKGIESIASSFGFSGVEPNTIMMGWPQELNHSADYATMTEKLLYLDYNLLYLDFDKKKKFGNYQTVDLWWRETDSKNAEMMLNIARFILQSPQWNNASIRVLFVNHNNIDNQIIKSKIAQLVKDLRVNVEIKVINNGVEQKPFYDIIALQSAHTDLTLIGIPNIRIDKQAEFIVNTNHLFETIGSTLMVKASNNFNELELDLSQEDLVSDQQISELHALPKSENTVVNNLIQELDAHYLATLTGLSKPALTSIASFYAQFIEDIRAEFDTVSNRMHSVTTSSEAIPIVQDFIENLIGLSSKFRENKLLVASEVLDKGINTLMNSRQEFVDKAAVSIAIGSSKKLKWKRMLTYAVALKITPNTQKSLYDFGTRSFVLLNALTEGIANQSTLLLENINAGKNSALNEFSENINELLLNQKMNALNLKEKTLSSFQNFERNICIELLENCEKPNFIGELKKEYRSIQKKELRENVKDIVGFAKNWNKNQQLSHNQAETGWRLLLTGLGLAAINETVKTHLKDSIVDPQRKRLDLLSKVSKALGKKEIKGAESGAISALAEGISHINFANLFEEEEKKSVAISQRASKSVQLMSPDSFNVLFKQQGEGVETITVDLLNIQNYIIQTYYLAPLQDNLLNLEDSFNKTSEQIYNSANHISQLIHVLDKESSSKESEDLIQEEQENIAHQIAHLNNLAAGFSFDLRTNLHQTQENLNIRTIIDSEELLAKASQKTILKSGFQKWLQKKGVALKAYSIQAVDFINKHRQEIDSLKFEESHKTYFNRIEQSRTFIESHIVDPNVGKVLPFYYKKLFSGSHLAGSRSTQKLELNKALNALDSIKSGTSGAILIIGDSLSGKTHFSESVAKTLVDVERIDVNPPEKQSYSGHDIDLAFQGIFSKKGTSLSILNQFKRSRCFVFNDIERWWTRSTNGNEAVNYLVELIEKVGDKHFFILNSNKYSYQIIKETTRLDEVLLATILIRPSNSHELRGIILNRHKIGGAEVFYKNEPVHQSAKFNQLVNKIHTQSSGNIGVALNIWLSSIRLTSEGELTIYKPSMEPFPNINNPEWKLLLYNFILHRKLSDEQLKEKLYKEAFWLKGTLLEMQKSSLVLKLPDGRFELNSPARFYIEGWLKTLSFLN